MLSIKEVISVSLILFSVIDIIGSVPIIIELRKKAGNLESGRATLVAGAILLAFLFLGEALLKLFGLDIGSFASAGAIVIFLIGLEMILGIRIFRGEISGASSSIVPLAFPLIAGAGTLTTILSLKAEFAQVNIILGIIINMLLVYLVLKTSAIIERLLGKAGEDILRKVFGIILLAISVKIIKTHFLN